jgi:hypothetical protein
MEPEPLPQVEPEEVELAPLLAEAPIEEDSRAGTNGPESIEIEADDPEREREEALIEAELVAPEPIVEENPPVMEREQPVQAQEESPSVIVSEEPEVAVREPERAQIAPVQQQAQQMIANLFAPQGGPEKVYRVVIHYDRLPERLRAEMLANLIENHYEFEIRDIRQVDSSSKFQIRYFYPEDEVGAKSLAEVSMLGAKQRVEVLDLSKSDVAFKAKPGSLEVWM